MCAPPPRSFRRAIADSGPATVNRMSSSGAQRPASHESATRSGRPARACYPLVGAGRPTALARSARRGRGIRRSLDDSRRETRSTSPSASSRLASSAPRARPLYDSAARRRRASASVSPSDPARGSNSSRDDRDRLDGSVSRSNPTMALLSLTATSPPQASEPRRRPRSRALPAPRPRRRGCASPRLPSGTLEREETPERLAPPGAPRAAHRPISFTACLDGPAGTCGWTSVSPITV